MRRFIGSSLVALFLVAIVGCETAPKTQADKKALVLNADAALAQMKARDAGLGNLVSNAHGYAIFPEIGKGGLIVGGAYGRGIVYEKGVPIGYVELNQASVGATLGGQTYAELLVFKTADALGRLKSGNFDLGADASAVALTAGAAAGARMEGGVGIFVMPKGGAMVDASVNGQKFNYEPMTAAMMNDLKQNMNNKNMK